MMDTRDSGKIKACQNITCQLAISLQFVTLAAILGWEGMGWEQVARSRTVDTTNDASGVSLTQ